MSKSIEDVTGTVIELLTPEADPSVQKHYLQPLRCVVFDAALHVFSPNRYILDFVQTHCHERLQAIADDLESVVDAQVCYRVGNWQDHFTFPQKLSACLCEAGVPPRNTPVKHIDVYSKNMGLWGA